MALSPSMRPAVDDEPEMLALLNEWLEEDGHQVETATNGWEAFEIFVNRKPALTITDLGIPGMDGLQLISRISEISDAHVIALTSMGGDKHALRGFDMGAYEYLVKPESEGVFLACVGSLLRRAASDGEIALGRQDRILTLKFLSREAQVEGANLRLRPAELKLLAYLNQNSNRVQNRQQLLNQVWDERQGSLDSIKWCLSALRERTSKTILATPRSSSPFRGQATGILLQGAEH